MTDVFLLMTNVFDEITQSYSGRLTKNNSSLLAGLNRRPFAYKANALPLS